MFRKQIPGVRIQISRVLYKAQIAFIHRLSREADMQRLALVRKLNAAHRADMVASDELKVGEICGGSFRELTVAVPVMTALNA